MSWLVIVEYRGSASDATLTRRQVVSALTMTEAVRKVIGDLQLRYPGLVVTKTSVNKVQD